MRESEFVAQNIEWLETLANLSQQGVPRRYFGGYTEKRGLYDDPENERYHGYNTTMGFRFDEYIRERLSRGDDRLVLLDIACGAGKFLGYIGGIFGDDVAGFGIDPIFYLNSFLDESRHLVGDGINVEEEGCILRLLTPEIADIVTFQYCGMGEGGLPPFCKEVSRILRPKGIAKIFQDDVTTHDAEQIESLATIARVSICRQSVRQYDPVAITSGYVITLQKS